MRLASVLSNRVEQVAVFLWKTRILKNVLRDPARAAAVFGVAGAARRSARRPVVGTGRRGLMPGGDAGLRRIVESWPTVSEPIGGDRPA